jgi:WD40 repeat protein
MSERTPQVKLVIFPAASLGVVYDSSTHTQTFYLGHKSVPIGVLEIHPAGDIVATGEIRQNAEIHVWKTGNGVRNDGPNGISILNTAEDVKGVASLSFSQEGSILGAVVLNADNDILIYDWANTNSPITRVNGYSDTVR